MMKQLVRFRVFASCLGALLSGAILGGCDENAEAPSSQSLSRGQAVVASNSAKTSGARANPREETSASRRGDSSAATEAPAKERKEPRRLCDKQWDEPGPVFEPTSMSRAAAQGFELPDEKLQLTGALTWVNFWAAWCKPCKEEIPRLVEWQEKLNGEGEKFRLAFVSLDDDERQLRDFMRDQPQDGLKGTYWLKDGRERNEWLAAAGMDTDPELPTHLLIDASGRVRCILSGAVEDADFERVQELTAQR